MRRLLRIGRRALTSRAADSLCDGFGLPQRIFGESSTPAGFFVDAWLARRVPFASYATVGALLAALLAGLVALAEYLSPYAPPASTHRGNIFIFESWSPIVGGVIVGKKKRSRDVEIDSPITLLSFALVLIQGFLQAPSLLLASRAIGSSSAYVTLVAQPFRCAPSLLERFAYLKRFSRGIGMWFQPVYLAGAVLGALTSALASGRFAWRVDDASPLGERGERVSTLLVASESRRWWRWR